MKIKAESNTKGTKLFNDEESALKWDSEAHVFNIFSPGKINDVKASKLAIVDFTEVDENALIDKSKAKMIDQFALKDFLEDCGFEVDELVTYDHLDLDKNLKQLGSVNPVDYDAIIVNVGSMYIDNKKLRTEQRSRWEFLQEASFNSVKIIALYKDVSIPFYEPRDIFPSYIDNSDSHLYTSKVVSLVQTTSPAERNSVVQLSTPSKDIRYAPISSISFDYLRNHKKEALEGSLFDICYVGGVRNGERLESLYEFIVKPAVLGYKVLWIGMSFSKLIKAFDSSRIVLSAKDKGEILFNIHFEDKTDANDFFSSSYSRSIATVIPFQKSVNNIITSRFYETQMSESVTFIDDSFPVSSEMGAFFEDDRRVKNVKDFCEKIDALKDSTYSRMTDIHYQREIARYKAVEDLKAFKNVLFDAIYGGE